MKFGESTMSFANSLEYRRLKFVLFFFLSIFIIYKKTVGKTYMACAGLKAGESNISPHILAIEKTRRALNAAFDIRGWT